MESVGRESSGGGEPPGLGEGEAPISVIGSSGSVNSGDGERSSELEPGEGGVGGRGSLTLIVIGFLA
jgi:hypothetical protein